MCGVLVSLVYSFINIGSIDPSKDPSDILNLNGVNPDDPSTFNESFYICDENNICVFAILLCDVETSRIRFSTCIQRTFILTQYN